MTKAISLSEVADQIAEKRRTRRPLDVSGEAAERHNRTLALAKGFRESVSVSKAVNTGPTGQTGKTSPGVETAEELDPLSQLQESGKVIEPPFDLMTLAMLSESSSELGQCVDAMEMNIEGFGYRFVPRVKNDDKNKMPAELEAAVNSERVRLTNFFMYASMDEDFITLRRILRRDLEMTGNAYLELVRDAQGQVQQFNHVPAHQMRIGRLEDSPREVEIPILEMKDDNSIVITKVKRMKRHRKYVQRRTLRNQSLAVLQTGKVVWFKEFQDPRIIDNTNGEEVKEAAKIDELRAKNQLANEVIHFRLYSSRTVYGVPRYIGNLLSIFGDRAAEEINYITFKNNNIPSMAILVSNGMLTQGTVDRIESFVESQIQGSDNYSKFLILEAETFSEGDDGGQIKLDIKPLTKDQHKDAMFQQYSSNNRNAIRQSFRLPPIFVGRADEYTRATAESSRRLADEQIFAPARDQFDAFMNLRLFPEMGVRYHKFKSNSPNTTDNAEMVRILSDAEKTGGMTPRIARMILTDVLGIDLPPFPEDFDPDVPFSLTMAEAVKNEADPTEPGQQVTALKVLKSVQELWGSDPSPPGESSEDTVTRITRKLTKMRDSIESEWSKAVGERYGSDD